ncbi:FTR1 family iron permease [Dyella sp.]|jgi:high-affinity iron transporter|uniref:FTR1 family iron permease n=1 Tax=Dyella sp. TaxID=1869338 RepID=UPI002D78CDC6|nr:FTR1 family protein [Dyella sp.]HET6431232.1 FTR1 family protein [Dyella sp.]
MPGVALLVFREVMEAALIVSIVCAATRGVDRRGLYVAGGIGLGLFGAVLVALGAGAIAQLARGVGQELMNAGVLLAAVVMIGWHVVWMARHSRELAQHMGAVGQAVKAGSSSLTLLLAVVGLAVLREGSEVVLFVYSMAMGGIGVASLAGGIALGVASGALLGYGLYVGLLRIPMKHFFRATNVMLVLLAAGLASTAARFLVQASWLPAWGEQLWDSSWLLSNGSLAGKTLSELVGYDASPAGIQLVFYAVTAIALFAGMRWLRAPPAPTGSRAAPGASAGTPQPQH